MKYLNYYNFLKNGISENYQLLVGQTKKSFLIGPKISTLFDARSFYLRIVSNCIYNKKIYKKHIKKSNLDKIITYYDVIDENKIIEIFDNKIIIHKFQNVPGVANEKK